MFLEKFSEILSCNAYVNIIVYLYGNSHAVASSNAEAARKHNLVLNMIFLYSVLKQLYYLLGALEVAG